MFSIHDVVNNRNDIFEEENVTLYSGIFYANFELL